ncbi:hypothetical protein QVD17_18241 [Tagetes erecta]|uniref:Uncharacterized protein n=1 Tax=Tagetes erecta TaxID=13708 RepID=A0AAD8KKT1_TARER|nr:hypothetical protein QVD17_18241 [Tagetes erecta]
MSVKIHAQKLKSFCKTRLPLEDEELESDLIHHPSLFVLLIKEKAKNKFKPLTLLYKSYLLHKLPIRPLISILYQIKFKNKIASEEIIKAAVKTYYIHQKGKKEY